MPRPTVCVTEQIHPDALARLSEAAEVVGPGPEAADWPERADAVIVRSAPVTADQLRRAARLRVVGKHGAGTDTIDTDAARAAGVAVLTAANANAESVADLALAFALMLTRAPDLHDAALRAGAPLGGAARVGFELAELPTGILGLGAIGRAVARRLTRGFGVEVCAYDPGLPDDLWPSDIRRMPDVAAVLERSRMLFLHLPLLPQTRHLIGAEQLARLPKGAFLVNCARGGIVDDHALAEALRSGHLAGAASDVFEQEPPAPDHPLFASGRFIGASHIGASTDAGLRRTGLLIVERVLEELARTGQSKGETR